MAVSLFDQFGLKNDALVDSNLDSSKSIFEIILKNIKENFIKPYIYEKIAEKGLSSLCKKLSDNMIAKCIGKKIPFISLIFGVYYAFDRYKDGDNLGAIGEFLSGVAGCWPGFGTIASFATDIILFVRDVWKDWTNK